MVNTLSLDASILLVHLLQAWMWQTWHIDTPTADRIACWHAGANGKRLSLSHGRVMIHQPEGGAQGQATEILTETEEVLRLRRRIAEIYAEKTGQPLNRIARDMDRDRFLSAREAKDYGIIDLVAQG